jgi:hypothetical protein
VTRSVGCLVAGIGLIALSAVGRPVCAADVSSHPWIGQSAPGFSLPTVAGGDTVSLADLKGSYLVIHFGTSW